MKIVIENKTNVPDHEVVSVVARLMQQKYYPINNSADIGCYFWFKEQKYLVSRVPNDILGLADELAFLVADTKGGEKCNSKI